MRNVTISMRDEVARWVRVQAAERDMSVSRFIGELLGERMREEETYASAMRAFLAARPVRLRASADEPLPAREALHSRGVRHPEAGEDRST